MICFCIFVLLFYLMCGCVPNVDWSLETDTTKSMATAAADSCPPCEHIANLQCVGIGQAAWLNAGFEIIEGGSVVLPPGSIHHRWTASSPITGSPGVTRMWTLSWYQTDMDETSFYWLSSIDSTTISTSMSMTVVEFDSLGRKGTTSEAGTP